MQYLTYFFSAFVLSLVLTPIVRLAAIRNKLVAFPRADRWHKEPTAILGGISIFIAAIIPSLFVSWQDKGVMGLLIGSTFLFLVGLADDRFHFAPYTKLFAQIIAGCIAIFFGISLGLPENNFLAIPLTLLWIIGVTNSFNLLDNIDGLAAGIAAISSVMLFASSLIFSNNYLGVFGLILAGAALGFLPYNFNPAKIFMGDSGSMFLGYSLAVLSLTGATRHISSLLITMLIPVLILSVPIFDTIFVMVARILQDKNIFEGGKDHTSHRLVTLGLSQRKTVLLLYSLSIVFGLIAISYSRLNFFIISTITFLGIVVLVFFGMFLFEGTSYKNNFRYMKSLNNANGTIINNIFLHKRRIVEVLLDFGLICIAYYTAYFLRFEGTLLSSNSILIKESLIWIILINMSTFFSFGLYRGVWRYISISDFFTIFKVVSLGSIFSILFLTFTVRFKEYSRAVFFINWLLLLFLILGSRFLFRMVGEFLVRMRKGGKNIIIFGAGDTGEMVIREIKRNRSFNYNVIGFIDDDPHKIGNKIHGVPILGSREQIISLARENDIQEIIIAISSIDIDNLLDIAKICSSCGIPFRKISGILDKKEKVEFGQS